MQTLQEKDELAELEVVLLPRLELLPSPRWGYIKLYVLDLLVAPAVGQVVGLSAYDLPRSGKGLPHFCGFRGDSPPTGPPPRGLLRTPHP